MFGYEINPEHQEITTKIVKAYQDNDCSTINELVLRAGKIRGVSRLMISRLIIIAAGKFG